MPGRATKRSAILNHGEDKGADVIETILVVFWGLVLLTVIILVHEVGHFLAARIFGMRVNEFAMGLPGVPSVGHTTRKGTRFALTCIPLGGYNRIAGMQTPSCGQREIARAYVYLCKYGSLRIAALPNDAKRLDFDLESCLETLFDWGTVTRIRSKDGMGSYKYQAPEIDGYALGEAREVATDEKFIASEYAQTYDARPFWKRMVTLFAGSLFNVLFFIVIITASIMILGSYQPDRTLGSVIENSPAYEAGFEAGDTLISCDGVAIDSWSDLGATLSSHKPGDTVMVVADRNGVTYTHDIVLGDNGSGGAFLGVTAGVRHVSYGFFEAIQLCFYYIGVVAGAIISLFNPFRFTSTVQNSLSIVGVSYVAKDAASLGGLDFIVLCAEVSLSIGLANLLPILPLDGGRIVIECYQRITRKVASPTFQNWYAAIGLTFFLFIFMITVFQDVNNYVLG